MAKKIYEGDILRAMESFVDYEPMVFGANGHYSVGAYFDLNDTYMDSEDTKAAEMFRTDDDTLPEYLQKAYWMFYF